VIIKKGPKNRSFLKKSCSNVLNKIQEDHHKLPGFFFAVFLSLLKNTQLTFAPLLKQFIETALEAEMSTHLDDIERIAGNKRNGKNRKHLKLVQVKLRFPHHRSETASLSHS